MILLSILNLKGYLRNMSKKHEEKKSNSKAALSSSNMEQNSGDGSVEKEAITPFDSRVNIHVHSIRSREVDSDGISAKAAIDGLVVGGLLQDDSPRFVEKVSYSQERGKPEETYLIIEEIDK